MSLKHYRDLSLAAVPGGTIVVAADSCAATGEKSGDALPCPPYHCGRVSARVVLFELLCIGAQVLVIADGVCAESARISPPISSPAPPKKISPR